MKTYFKTVRRMFKKEKSRMFSILFILLISIGLSAGVGMSPTKINNSITEYYQERNVSDLIIKSTRTTGFTEEEIDILENLYGIDNIMTLTSFDLENNDEISRYYYLDLGNININKLELIEGNFPENDNEVLVERSTSKLKKYNIGDEIIYNNVTYKVSGIVKNPLYFQKLEEVSYIDDKNLDNIVYLNTNILMPINEVHISFEDRDLLENMSDDYEDLVLSEKKNVEKNIEDIVVLTLYENISFNKLFTLTDKINIITIVLLIGFIFVSALVVLSTMSRLLEEERKNIACLKTLGYSNSSIILKYLIFAFVSTIIGAMLAYFVGIFITDLIYYNFDAMFDMPTMSTKITNFHYFLTTLILIISTLIVTFNSGLNIVREKPATMFKRKAPKKGKKILLEKIPKLWNRLSFKYKSTFRNIFRYKKHFFMTVISVAGSTVLVFLALGLLSYSLTDELLGDALIFICFVVLIFAGLLTILVIYTLTNINISERYKEISTLMVLGYYDNEVRGYIYREIYIMCLIGIILGIPLGYISLNGLFELLDFGSMSDVGMYIYFITPLLIILFTILITLILKKKITNIDLDESLKEVD